MMKRHTVLAFLAACAACSRPPAAESTAIPLHEVELEVDLQRVDEFTDWWQSHTAELEKNPLFTRKHRGCGREWPKAPQLVYADRALADLQTYRTILVDRPETIGVHELEVIARVHLESFREEVEHDAVVEVHEDVP